MEGVGKKLGKIGIDDPRIIIHSLKVGLALIVVSIFYYVNRLFAAFDVYIMWAVLTVVLIMEYNVGGTVSKGLNRAFATLLGGAIGLGAHRLAALCGDAGEPILLSVFVFIVVQKKDPKYMRRDVDCYRQDGVSVRRPCRHQGELHRCRRHREDGGSIERRLADSAAEHGHHRLLLIEGSALATFLRFVPKINAIFDYGLMIFILTFSLVAVSSYRVEELIVLAYQRLFTIAIGVAISLFISIFVFPIWAGEDLHNHIAANLDKLASYLKGLGEDYFGEKTMSGQNWAKSYKDVINSNAKEDSLAKLARWEPCHGRFRLRYPWKQYRKIGALTRQCASSIQALHAYILTPKQNQPIITDPEFQKRIRSACAQMSFESGKALGELATAIRKMVPPSAAQHLENCTAAADIINAAVPSKDASLSELLSTATTASLLLEVVSCARHVATAVEELGRIAQFKQIVAGESTPHMIIEIEE